MKMAAQFCPYRPPILRCRFHHHLLHPARLQPGSHMLQLRRAGSKAPSFEGDLPLLLNVGCYYHQHRFVYVNSCYCVRHRCLLLRNRGTHRQLQYTLFRATPVPGRNRGAPFRNSWGVPDHSPFRPRLLQFGPDLDRSAPSYSIGTDFHRSECALVLGSLTLLCSRGSESVLMRSIAYRAATARARFSTFKLTNL